ncbi:MAG: redoxin domain-containing protein, partial [Mobilitalea sp.]
MIIISNNNLHINKLNNNINNQENERRTECVTIGRLAPDFTALSTQGYIKLSDYRGKWVLLSSNPMGFTPVSTTEIIAAAQNYSEFQKRNTQLLSLTTDNNFANLAWIYDISQNTGVTIPFPIITDRNYTLSELYGMYNPDRVYEESVRDVFIINPVGKIMAIITLPVSCGIGVF